MLTQFDTISDASRIWIYQANRKLAASEEEAILSEVMDFMSKWAAHGQGLQASATIKHAQFLIIATDEAITSASGCSIDSSVHLVQEIGERFKVDFFDRLKLAFLTDSSVTTVPLDQLKTAIKDGLISAQSQFFNNTITNKGELKDKWLVNASESWLKRYFIMQESV